MDRQDELLSDDPSDGEWIDTTDDETESDDSWHTSDEEFIDDDDDWEVQPVVLNVNVTLPNTRSRLDG